jgi:hypothetical protein
VRRGRPAGQRLQLSTLSITVRHHGGFASVAGQLPDGTSLTNDSAIVYRATAA